MDQNYVASDGAVLAIDSESTGGASILVDSAATTGNTVVINVPNATTGSALFIERANNGSQYSDTTEGLAYIAQLDNNSNGLVLHTKSTNSSGVDNFFEHVGLAKV